MTERAMSRSEFFEEAGRLGTSWKKEDFINLDENGQPYWDDLKIFPNPIRRAQYYLDLGMGMNSHAMAEKYPEWAITDRPAEVVRFNLGGHPSCL